MLILLSYFFFVCMDMNVMNDTEHQLYTLDACDGLAGNV